MADKIRGLTVEISADAKQFNKSMNEMRNAAKSSQAELNALQKSLELKFDSATFARAQKVAQDAIDQTAKNAETLRERLAYLESTGNIDTAQYQKLQAELAQTELKAQQLQQQLEKINSIKYTQLGSQLQTLGGSVTKVGQALAPVSALAGTAVAGIGALGVKAAATGAEIDDLSLRLGVSAEKVQEWKYVAAQAGVDWEVFNKALIKGRAALLDLSSGTVNNATKAIQSLGLNINSFATKEEMFDGLINALAGMEDKTLQAAYANEIFGDKIANQMLPFLNTGAEAINQFKDEFAGMSYLTNEQVSALATLDDTIYLVKESLKNVCLQIGASFAPLLQRTAEIINTQLVPKLQQLATWFNNLSLAQQEGIIKALLFVAALAPVITMIGKLISGVGGIIKVLPQLGSALSALEAHPIIAIIGVIATILILLYTRCEAFREAINRLVETLGQALQPALDAIMQVLNLVMAILTPIIDLVGNILAVAINAVSDALQPVIEAIQAVFAIIQPLLDIVMSALNGILQPLTQMLSGLFSILTPILNVALIPLKLVLQALQVPLKVLGTLLGWLAPLFQVFGNIVSKIFQGVIFIINLVLGVVEDAVNFVIGIINGLIDGVNAALGWLGVHIDRIAEVKLRIDTSEIEDMDDVNAIIDDTPPDTSGAGGSPYDTIGAGGTGGDTYNNDYSTNTTTQNVQVVIQNYAAEVDVDDMVRQINQKLAEAM